MLQPLVERLQLGKIMMILDIVVHMQLVQQEPCVMLGLARVGQQVDVAVQIGMASLAQFLQHRPKHQMPVQPEAGHGSEIRVRFPLGAGQCLEQDQQCGRQAGAGFKITHFNPLGCVRGNRKAQMLCANQRCIVCQFGWAQGSALSAGKGVRPSS